MAAITHKNLTAARMRELFSYDPETGILTRIKGRHDWLGPVSYGTNGTVAIDGTTYIQSRVMWLWYYGKWPEELVDHKDRNRKNNRITNLRDATYTQNQHNKVMDNSNGYKGVTWRNRLIKPWMAQIRINKIKINLGSFKTKEEAAKAYEEACLKYHGEFANLGVA